ncbi:MAG: hypothetical protein ABIZ34_03340 [Candidatus Limnocylindrales bacterium]
MIGWWAGKVRQFRRHLTGRVTEAERASLDAWLSPAQTALFDAMPRADRRHGLDVVMQLRESGHAGDDDLLLAGLLHDCGKGPGVGIWHRVAWSLGERYGERVLSLTGRVPGFRTAFERIRVHADLSAEMALAAGCSPRAADLIRYQSEPVDPVAGEALRLADEAS